MVNAEAKGLENKQYRTVAASDMNFPYHIHRTYELMRVISGTAQIRVDGNAYDVKKDQCAMVFPLQYHSFRADAQTKIKIYIFSPELVPEFTAAVRNKIPVSPIVRVNTDLFMSDSISDVFSAKSFYYSLCGDLVGKLDLSECTTRTDGTDVLNKIFLYVDSNYSSDCSLKRISEALRYDYTYLSKCFKSKTGVSYNSYINSFRINKACYLLINRSDKSITEIAGAVGFETIRTFNREFMKVTGYTPIQYRLRNYFDE